MNLNLAGYKWLWYDGYGRMSLGVAQALLRAGHTVHPFEIDLLKEKPAWFIQAQGLTFDRVTVQLMPPDMMRQLPGRSVGWSMHESMNLPKGWADRVNACNQWLLVPSPWLIEVFQNAGVKVPIDVVPGGIDPDECPLRTAPRSGPFTFGCLADRGSRKGWIEVYTAFYRAFDTHNQDVRLIMKCRPGSLQQNDFSYASDSRLTVWRADVERVADMFAPMDCFVFPSHCEGYGMPPRESAAMGIPTIVGRWSGTADDCDDWAVPLDRYQLVESDMEGCGGLWARFDLDELIWRMRDIYQNQDTYRARARESARWLRDHTTYAHAAERLTSVLAYYLGGPVVQQQRYMAEQARFKTPEPDFQGWINANREVLDLVKRQNGHQVVVLEDGHG